MDYKISAMNELREYEDRKEALENIRQRLETLRQEYESIPSRGADTVPVQGGGNRQEERMIGNIFERQSLTSNYRIAKMKVEQIERSLSALSDEERAILSAFASASRERERYVADRLATEKNMDRSTVYRIRNRALRRYTMKSFGVVDV